MCFFFSSEQMSDICESAKWWFSKISFRSDNHLCVSWKNGPFSISCGPGRCVFFQDNQRKLCESSSEQMRSNHRFGRTIREHCSLNILFIKCVQSTITRERCSLHCLVNMVYSVFTGHCKMYSTVCNDHPWTLITEHTKKTWSTVQSEHCSPSLIRVYDCPGCVSLQWPVNRAPPPPLTGLVLGQKKNEN